MNEHPSILLLLILLLHASDYSKVLLGLDLAQRSQPLGNIYELLFVILLGEGLDEDVEYIHEPLDLLQREVTCILGQVVRDPDKVLRKLLGHLLLSLDYVFYNSYKIEIHSNRFS